MKGYVVVECTNGKSYESVKDNFNDEEIEYIKTKFKDIKNVQNFYIETCGGEIYFNPNQVVAIWFKEIV